MTPVTIYKWMRAVIQQRCQQAYYQVSIRLVKSAKMHHFTVNSFHSHTWNSDYWNALLSQQENVEKIYMRLCFNRTGSLSHDPKHLQPEMTWWSTITWHHLIDRHTLPSCGNVSSLMQSVDAALTNDCGHRKLDWGVVRCCCIFFAGFLRFNGTRVSQCAPYQTMTSEYITFPNAFQTMHLHLPRGSQENIQA